MVEDLGPEDVVGPPATWDLMLKRGLRKRCPRCGAGRIYRSWFRMRERCPGCGFKFEREPGFFVGAYLINFAITEGFVFVAIMVFVFVKDANRDVSVLPVLAVALTFAVVAPLLAYPFARTIWSAIDLAMTPLELKEIVAARDALEGGDDEPS